MVPEGPRRIAHGLNIRRIFDERLAHGVHTVFESELQAIVVVFGEGADAEVDARKVEPLARAQFTAHDDTAADITALNLLNIDLNQTVVQVKRIAGRHDLGKASKCDRDPVRIADHVVTREGEKVAGFQIYRFRVKLPDAHLR